METVKTHVTPNSLPQGKPSSLVTIVSGTPEEIPRPLKNRKNAEQGLVGFVNIGNSCYMNATLQALSNCPPFSQYFVEIFQPSSSSSSSSSSSQSSAASVLSSLLKKVWSSDRHPGHLSPRVMSSSMKNLMFRGSQQQDAQEFLRCLLTQIHEEISIQVPSQEEWPHGCGSCDHHCCHRDSMVSCDSDTSADSQSRLVESIKNSPLIKNKSTGNSSSSLCLRLPSSTHSSPASQSKFFLKYNKIKPTSSAKSSVENIPLQGEGCGETQGAKQTHSRDTLSGGSMDIRGASKSSSHILHSENGVEWTEKDMFVVDISCRKVTIHRNYLTPSNECLLKDESCDQESTNQITSLDDSLELDSSADTADSSEDPAITSNDSDPQEVGVVGKQGVTKMEAKLSVSADGAALPLQTKSSLHSPTGHSHPHSPTCHSPSPLPPHTTSIVSETFEGILESKVKCLTCKKVSITREPFQDLSLPIPGRKDIAKFNSKVGTTIGGSGGDSGDSEEEESGEGSAFTRGFCTFFNYFTSLTRDMITGPPTNITDCLNGFFETSELKGDDRYYCSNCKSFQNSEKAMSIASLPEVLCIHLKRFRFDAYFSTKISRHIRFPLMGLDMGPYLKHGHQPGHLYELNSVITHYGGAGGGHYVAFAKNMLKNSWYEFNDTRVYPVNPETVLNAEGYVLFYRKSLPNGNQTALQSLDITTFLPPKGTTLPSPSVCYISRHWLHLLKHTSHPGPIFQFDFSCKHGAVHPTITLNDARSLSLSIRRDVWDSFQHIYGGGPLFQKLEICRVCQELLSQLNERRKLEKDTIHKVQSKERKSGEDRKLEPYLLSLSWLQQWKKFIHCTTLEFRPPVAIDNSPLLQFTGGTNGRTKTIVLVEEAPFRMVSKTAWDYFYSIYGGGPVILTSLEPIIKDDTVIVSTL